ncbi:MAG: SDR family oxidoreductase [Gemmatimonadetes bacterium]|nr:SDR family oxidoreductase [Gemmatimonadota bacterium]NNM07361.1 SDR family oxidoreductase [Gemmatimonadota bacterium]
MIVKKKTVVITGASSGIGKATALHLDQLGFEVLAGVRRETDIRALADSASPRLRPLFLDVTEADSIAAAVEEVAGRTNGELFGLINNAGLSMNGPLELVKVSEIEKVFDVNVIGLLGITKAFIPLLRKGKGRLINISSGHGLLAIPDKSVYAASKFAVQAISDALRTELAPFGVSVSNLVVGKVDTAVLGKILAERDAMVEASDPDIVELYRPLFEFFDGEVKNMPGIPPTGVGETVAKALTSKKPKAEYLIGPGAKKMKNLARLPRGLRDRMMYQALYKGRKTEGSNT